MTRIVFHPNGAKQHLWDDVSRTYTEYDEQGVQIGDAVPYTPEENAAADAEAAEGVRSLNETELRSRAEQALAANLTYLGITSPTSAQVGAQVKRLTKQVNALIRLEIAALDDISDTV